MADSRFFDLKGPFSIGDIVKLTNSKVSDESFLSVMIEDVAPLDKAEGNHLAFFDNAKYIDSFKTTNAKACIVREEVVKYAPSGTICIVNQNPYKAYAIAAAAFYPEHTGNNLGISDKAIIANTAIIGKNTVVYPGAVVGENVKIGENCVINSNAVISRGCELGNNVNIGTNVSIQCALIGNNVVIYPGAVIGRAGFGFAIDYETGFTSVPQLGRVIIEDNVYIGANTTVDRGAGPDTVIGFGTRVDNLVQIGHNVKIGKFCVIVSQVGISGSSKVGDFVMLGGQAGVAGHLTIGSGVKIGAKCGVTKNIPAGHGTEYMGTPAIPLKQYMRQVVTLGKLVNKNRSEHTNDK